MHQWHRNSLFSSFAHYQDCEDFSPLIQLFFCWMCFVDRPFQLFRNHVPYTQIARFHQKDQLRLVLSFEPIRSISKLFDTHLSCTQNELGRVNLAIPVHRLLPRGRPTKDMLVITASLFH